MIKSYEHDSAKYTLHLNALPESEHFARVHAVLVSNDGRVLLRVKGDSPRATTGGHIENFDTSLEAALKREILEEINCEIDRCDYFGYLEVIEPDGTRELWARMVARLAKILSPHPDPDRADNWIYGRVLLAPEEAISESERDFPLNAEQIPEAMRVAQAKKYFTKPQNFEREVINLESHD